MREPIHQKLGRAAPVRECVKVPWLGLQGLPFEVKGAVCFDGQAQFNSYTYLLGLAREVDGDGSRVYENTRALSVKDGEPCVVETDRGRIEASDVVIATHVPFPFKGEYWGKSSARRTYVVAAAIDPDNVPEGMYINAESPSRSIRSATTSNGETLLVVCGEGHKPGQDPDTEERYATLEAYSRDNFRVSDFRYRWSTQDYWTAYGIPFVGKLGIGSRHVWVGTGFSSWGITGGTAAAMILTDTITGRNNPHAALFDSTRPSVLASKSLYKEGADVAKRLVGDWLAPTEAERASEIRPGEGRIVRRGVEKVAAYRDEAGSLHAGCVVQWNTAEKSWDCPCHASRFDVDGKVLQGTAVRDLGERSLPG